MESAKLSEVVANLAKLIKAKQHPVLFFRYMRESGVDPRYYKVVMKEAEALAYPPTGGFFTRRVRWGLALVAVITIFFLLPPSFFHFSTWFFALIFAALAGFFLVQFISDYRSYEMFKDMPKEIDHRTSGPIIGAVVVVPLIILFMWVGITRASDDMAARGEVTTGVIFDGFSRESRRKRRSTYTLQVEFVTAAGKKIRGGAHVSETTFNSVAKGQEVLVMYLPEDPKEFSILASSADFKRYLGTEERELKLRDMISFISIPTDSLEAKLNKIRYGWQLEEDGVWRNGYTNGELLVEPNFAVRCISYLNEDLLYRMELAELGFDKVPNDSTAKGTNYLNDSLILNLSSVSQRSGMLYMSGTDVTIYRSTALLDSY